MLDRNGNLNVSSLRIKEENRGGEDASTRKEEKEPANIVPLTEGRSSRTRLKSKPPLYPRSGFSVSRLASDEREGGRGIEYLGSVFGIGEGVDDAIYDTAVRNELVVVGLKEVRT